MTWCARAMCAGETPDGLHVRICAMVDQSGGTARVRSRLGLGCVKLGGTSTTPSADTRLVHAAVDCGVNTFDTADIYNSGGSERALGRALGNRRDKVTIMTKGGYLFRERRASEARLRRVAAPGLARLRALRSRVTSPSTGSATPYGPQDFSAAYLRAAVDASLRRLGIDYIDVYQLHGPRSIGAGEVLDCLADLVRDGKVREFGVGLERLDDAVAWTRVPGLTRVQIPFGMLDPEARSTVLPAAHAAGVHVVVRGVLASGLLDADASAVGTFFDQRKFDMLEHLRGIAAGAGLTPQQLAMRWVLAHQAAETVLVGVNSVAHLTSICRDATSPLVDVDLVARVDEVVEVYTSRESSS